VLLVLVPAALGATSATADAAPLPAGTTALISGTADLLGLLPTPVSDSTSFNEAVSVDGTKVAFASASDGLLAGDDDEVENVYVKDLATGSLQLVSRATGVNGEPSHADCTHPAISDDGSRVAFQCGGALDPADTNGTQDVYVRDLRTGETLYVSRNRDGTAGNGGSSEPAIDADGTFVAFTTTASNLGDGELPNVRVDHVYRADVDGGARLLFSRTSMGAPNAEDAFQPSISDDGSRVAFETGENLSPTDSGVNRDIYVSNGAASQLVSRADGAAGAVGNRPSFNGIISGDGKVVAFASQATNLEPPPGHDNDGLVDVYVRSLQDNTTRLLTIKADGTKTTGGDSSPTSVDTTGSVVAFLSTATNLDPAANGRGIEDYVSKGGALTLVSRGDGPDGAVPDGGGAAAVSGDGNFAVMTVDGTVAGDADPRARIVIERDIGQATTRTVSRPPGSAPFANAGGDTEGGSVSADGRYVAFASDAPALGAPAGLGSSIFVRDVVTGSVTLASREDGALGAPLGFASEPQLSADGRRVAFVVEGTPDQVYVRDLRAGRTFIASRAEGSDDSGSPLGDNDSFAPTISDDGRRVAFLSSAANLSPDDTDNGLDSFVREVDAGHTLLADRADGPTGAKADVEAFSTVISGDGHSVAFETSAANLVPGDTDRVSDVYVRNVGAGTTTLVSLDSDGEKGNNESFAPSISRDGSRVAFLSTATNFDQSPGQQKLYVRDLPARTLTVAGRADGPNGAPIPDFVGPGLLSADGAHIAFVAGAQTSIAPGAPADNLDRIYERDLKVGVTRLISRQTGANGAPSDERLDVDVGGITADGGCVTYTGVGRLLPPPASGDHGNVYMRAVTADCGRASGPASRDTTAPVLRSVTLSRTRFRVAKGRTPGAAARAHRRAKGPGRGTVLRFTSSEAARLTLAIERAGPGRKAGNGRAQRCRPVRHRPKHRACTAYRDAVTLTRAIAAGRGHVTLTGRIGQRRMAAGRYRLTLTAHDGAGNRSKPVRRAFTIVSG
jgi:Tol biopolymer transport system component